MERTDASPVVWVTGGAGYIGSNVVRALIAKKIKPVIIDDFSTGSRRFVPPRVPVVEVDITESEMIGLPLEKAVAEHGVPETVIHLAANSNVKWCEENPIAAYHSNVISTYNVANLAEYFGVKKFTFISSAAVYGNVGRKPARTWGCRDVEPTNVYGRSKQSAEEMLGDYFKNHLNTYILRLFNVAGVGFGDTYNISPRGRPDPESGALFPSMVRQYLAQAAITMNACSGLFFNRSPVRDFIHVRDVADIIVRAAMSNYPRFYDAEPLVYNVGRGRPVPIVDLLQLTKYDKEELKTLVKWESARHEEIPYSVAGSFNLGQHATRTLADMWHDEVRWQKSKLYQLIKSDMSKETSCELSS